MPNYPSKPQNINSKKPLQGQAGGRNTSYTSQRSMRANKVHEFAMNSSFNKYGYRNREDITVLPPGVMVKGSYNVLTDNSECINIVRGYTLDGQANSTSASINGAFDWTKVLNNDTHIRVAGSDLEFRYVNPISEAVSWVSLGSYSSHRFNFTTFWDTTQLTTVMLYVNGSLNLYEWSGAVASLASSTSNTITLSGTQTWAQRGFYTSGTRSVVIGGVSYAYTGGEGSTTLTGVTPDASAAGAVGASIHQSPKTYVLASFPGMGANFKPDLISTLTASTGEQIYLGSIAESNIYISRSQNFQNYTQVAAGPRAPGDGAVKVITGYPLAFIPQEGNMFISAGKDQWYTSMYEQTTINITGPSTLAGTPTIYETLDLVALKTTSLQGAQSQSCVTKIKNNIAYLSFEPIVNSFGPVDNIYQSLQIEDMSFPIVNDMNSYDLTDSCMIYFRQFLYVSVPRERLIRVYNMSQNDNSYWEAPITYPIAYFSIIDDALYGHGYLQPETYKLFDGGDFNGFAYSAQAAFSYEQYGSREYPKSFNQFYIEGYISSNTTLGYGMHYDLDGCQTTRNFILEGSQRPQVCISSPGELAGLGKSPLGKNPLGGVLTVNSFDTGLPPKFRAIKQVSKLPFYEMQSFFYSEGKNQNWSIVAFGPNVSPATESAVSIQY